MRLTVEVSILSKKAATVHLGLNLFHSYFFSYFSLDVMRANRRISNTLFYNLLDGPNTIDLSFYSEFFVSANRPYIL